MSLKQQGFTDILTFARNSEKTYFGKEPDGFGGFNYPLKTAAVNEPAFDHDPVTGEALGISIHEQRTNLFLHSEDFTNSTWVKRANGTGSNPVITPNFGESPKGQMTADRIQISLNGGTSSSDISTISQDANVPSGSENNRSIYLKSNDGQVYDLIFGTNTSPSVFAQITVDDSWNRFDITQIADTTSSNVYFGLRSAGGVVVSDSADILVWGAQLEQGAFPTPYIPTTAAQETRQADVCSIDNIDQSDWFNPNEGTFVVECEWSYGTNVNQNGRFALEIGSDAQSRVILYNRGGVVGISSEKNNVIGFASETALPKIGLVKVAFSYTKSVFNCYVLNEKISDSLAFDSPLTIADRISVGDSFNAGALLCGTIKSIKYKPAAVSDAELSQLSSL